MKKLLLTLALTSVAAFSQSLTPLRPMFTPIRPIQPIQPIQPVAPIQSYGPQTYSTTTQHCGGMTRTTIQTPNEKHLRHYSELWWPVYLR